MKTILVTLLLAAAFLNGGCSRSDNQSETTVPATPNANLRADAERLRQATAKAAEERKKALERAKQAASPTPSNP